MCSPGLIDRVAASLNPAERATGAAAGGRLRTDRPAVASRSFARVVDLTHPLGTDFPTANGDIWLEIDDFMSFEVHGINFKRWHVHEHVGTHIDAPIHFSVDGLSAEQIPVESLVVPLAVIDIRARAAEDPDVELTLDDLRDWEARHGEVPAGCCVAMRSGWDRFAPGKRYRNADPGGTMHFPGIHVEVAQMLIEERDVLGLAVDTLSLDHGPSTTFPAHREWLPTGRWVAEGLANLADVPPDGATIVVGGPKVVGATGGPSRIFALV